MGTLVPMRYPTVLAAGAADHTYVKCGAGKAWACWGGKVGGTSLPGGSGSTLRADKIAEPDGKAGINCYLVNGVCHQAANRILLPAGVLVLGARGYRLSESLYGPYGRPSGPFGLCQAPFHQHRGVTGDDPGCDGPSSAFRVGEEEPPPNSRSYIDGALAIYGKAETTGGVLGADTQHPLMVELFMYMAHHALGSALEGATAGLLGEARSSTEHARMKLESAYGHEELAPGEFARLLDEETVRFQQHVADILEEDAYYKLLALKPGEWLTLADPEIVNRGAGRAYTS